LIGIVTGSITTVILADMSRLCQEGRKDEALRLFRTAAACAAAILFPTFVFFLITAEPFIESLFSAKYADSVAPFRLYLFTLPVRIVTYGAALMALGLTRIVLFRSIIDLALNAVLCGLFVWLFGYLGAVAAMLTTLAIWTVPYNLHSIARGFGVSFWKTLPFALLARIFLLSLAAAPFALLCLLPHALPKLVEFCLAAMLYWPIIIYSSHRMNLLPIASLLQRIPTRVAGFWSKAATP
jgi:O-antigen/teichoic acid export membrane protein